MPRTPTTTVSGYIATCHPAAQTVLTEIRRVAHAAVPGATETISHGMPALKLQRTFFYFAAFKHHVGVYPPLTTDSELVALLKPWANAKGNLKFPLTAEVPFDLIARLAAGLACQYHLAPP